MTLDTSDRAATLASIAAVVGPMVVLGLAVAWYTRPPIAEKSALVLELRDRVAHDRPRVVVLGNSQAEKAVDGQRLGRALADGLGEPAPLAVTGLTVSGATPAIWFLVLKNVVYASGGAPDVVLVASTPSYFFRTDIGEDDQLRDLAALSEASEPTVERLSARRDGRPAVWSRVERARAAQQDELLTAVRELSVGLVFVPSTPVKGGIRDRGRALSEQPLSRVFGNPRATDPDLHQRVIPIVEEQRERARIERLTPASTYVAALVDLARQHGSRIAFVRVPVPSDRVQGATQLDQSTRELATYLRREGEGWVDLSRHPLPDNAFLDRLHMSAVGSEIFSAALAEELLRLGMFEPGGGDRRHSADP